MLQMQVKQAKAGGSMYLALHYIEQQLGDSMISKEEQVTSEHMHRDQSVFQI